MASKPVTGHGQPRLRRITTSPVKSKAKSANDLGSEIEDEVDRVPDRR